MGDVVIGSRTVGTGTPTYVIAEAGVNHNGRRDMALRLVDAAADAGADAVKFQVFDPDELATAYAAAADYQRSAGASSQSTMLKSLVLTRDDYRAIADRCKTRGVEFLATPFDEESARFLVELDAPAIKIGSGDLTHLPFLSFVGRTGLPVLLSTGMSTLDEVESAVTTLLNEGVAGLILLHCVSSYPAPVDQVNLRAMDTMRRRFNVPVGYSDHCLDPVAVAAAVARGAVAIERHLTLDRRLPGPDHAASSTPDEFARLTADIRTIASALGDGVKRVQPSERDTAAVARRSAVARRAITAGETLAADMLAFKRPGTGVPPGKAADLIGRRVIRSLDRDSQVKMSDLEAATQG